MFNHRHSHMTHPEDALNSDRMNVKGRGRQPSEWNGEVQRVATDDGVQKGMRTVLEERCVNIHGLNADKLRELLWQYEVNIFTS